MGRINLSLISLCQLIRFRGRPVKRRTGSFLRDGLLIAVLLDRLIMVMGQVMRFIRPVPVVFAPCHILKSFTAV